MLATVIIIIIVVWLARSKIIDTAKVRFSHLHHQLTVKTFEKTVWSWFLKPFADMSFPFPTDSGRITATHRVGAPSENESVF